MAGNLDLMGTLSDAWAPQPGLRDTPTPVTHLLTTMQQEREQAQDDVWTPQRLPLLQFVQDAWPIVEQGRKYDHNWHIEALCEHAQACYTGEVTHLLVNLPPRSGKSIILGIMFHAWIWVMEPSFRLLYFSYAMNLAMRDARRARELIRSPWYQRSWGARVQINPEFDTIQRLRTTAGGQRFTSAVGGAGTGEGGQLVIIEDPHNVEEARHQSRADIEAAKDFILNVLPSRVETFNESRQIISGQRVAVDDISGEVLANHTHAALVIPMEYVEPEDGVKPVTALGWSDPRTEPGELMWPAHMNRRAADNLKKNNRLDWMSQFQQSPQAGKDRLFPRSNWRFFHEWPDPSVFSVMIQSWDLRFGDQKDSGSFVAGQVWAKNGANLYLLARVHERWSFPETCEGLKTMSAQWPQAIGKLVENKANGPALMQTLRTIVPGLIAVEPRFYGDKYARAQAVAFIQHAGNAWLPHPDLAPWVEDYMLHLERFPAPPDDDCDATSQAWRKLGTFQMATDPRQEQALKQHSMERQRQQALRQQASQPFKLSRTGA